MSAVETLRLPARVVDAAAASSLNGRLRGGTLSLDWTDVLELAEEAAMALLEGLNAADHADPLGVDTMSEAIADVVTRHLPSEVPVPAPKKTPRKAKVPKVPGPAIWTPVEAPVIARPEPTPPPQAASTPPIASRPLLAAPPPEAMRAWLEDAVVGDLLGPAGGAEAEIVDGTVRDRYLVGMLAPQRLRVVPAVNDRLAVQETGGVEDGEEDGDLPSEPTMFPSAMGMSFMVAEDAGPLTVTARWGRYHRGPSASVTTDTGRPKLVWKRIPMEFVVVLPALVEGPIAERILAYTSDDGAHPAVMLRGVARAVPGGVVASLFLVNCQDEPEERRDEGWLFQPELQVAAVSGLPVFRARPSHELAGDDAEGRAMAMLYRERLEFAVGHSVSVHATPGTDDPRRATRLETRVVPAFEVAATDTPGPDDDPLLAGLCLDMRELANTPRSELGRRLRALPDAYGAWIERQRARASHPDARVDGFGTEAKAALVECERVLARIRDGLALLAGHEQAAEAFRFANRAMWLQRLHTRCSESARKGEGKTVEELDVPKERSWRVFQLAFLLLNLDSVTNLHHPHRSDPSHAVSDLLWFPTGGGKTEAYLGLAAYTMALRRLQGEIEGRSGEHGVAVLMRYTLRLLTLQQFQRAAALICACESIRRESITAGRATWGTEPFRIGLWVGARSTPNTTEQSAEALRRVKKTEKYQPGAIAGSGSPVQLKSCPWCGSSIDPGRHVRVESFASGSSRTLTFCGDPHGVCPFSERNAPGEGLPVVVVDEEIYRRLPTLLIATVDKFAQMPWRGSVQMLFGQVTGHCERHGFSCADDEPADSDHPKRNALPATKLDPHRPVRPPDLIIQDELHLISGPLGTLTGLYETAIDELCSWDVGGMRVRPKVVASTATIRRARRQIRALFLRDVQVFPPQGLDVTDNFFAVQRPTSERPGRRYLGICAPGRRLKAAIIRVYVAHLAAAQVLFERYGAHADPWMTLVGYFGSLRELAGTRRLVDDDIASRLRRMSRRGLSSRRLRPIKELTSRLGSTEIPDLLDRLEVPFDPDEDAKRRAGERLKAPIDVLLATSMVSVGVDVKRLGLMVVAGQPKNTAEYIQATSRVGRAHPGLVCTIYNWARPRDLSHYETFEHYHGTFYNHVEALSVTPFAPRAVDRGLSALLVSLIRLCSPTYAPNDAAPTLRRDDPLVRRAVNVIVRRAELVEESTSRGDEVRKQLERRLDDWLAAANPEIGGSRLGYKTRRDGVTRGLLRPAGTGPWEAFTCLNSLRDVEPTTLLVLEDGNLDDEIRPFTRSGP